MSRNLTGLCPSLLLTPCPVIPRARLFFAAMTTFLSSFLLYAFIFSLCSILGVLVQVGRWCYVFIWIFSGLTFILPPLQLLATRIQISSEVLLQTGTESKMVSWGAFDEFEDTTKASKVDFCILTRVRIRNLGLCFRFHTSIANFLSYLRTDFFRLCWISN